MDGVISKRTCISNAPLDPRLSQLSTPSFLYLLQSFTWKWQTPKWRGAPPKQPCKLLDNRLFSSTRGTNPFNNYWYVDFVIVLLVQLYCNTFLNKKTSMEEWRELSFSLSHDKYLILFVATAMLAFVFKLKKIFCCRLLSYCYLYFFKMLCTKYNKNLNSFLIAGLFSNIVLIVCFS